jgi:putative intracellular protease/amidase
MFALAACGRSTPSPPAPADPAILEAQKQAFIEALRPRRAGRPDIAVIALNDATETTDFLLTHAVLKRADVADVQAVAPRAGRVRLYPALQVNGAQDLASFDQSHPDGADYVIVPAMKNDDDPEITAWLRQQSARGARIIGVCAGALVVANAGLLDGRRFATHWFFRDDLLERHPTAVYAPHQRYVIDRDVATTTGITASVPTMIALVESIGGPEKAQALADELGVVSWTPEHDSSRFGLNGQRMVSYVLNKLAFWRRDDWRVDVENGVDDIALAFAADAWSRTGQISLDVATPGSIKLRSGLTLEPTNADADAPRLPLTPTLKPLQQLDRTLCEIGERFGVARREWVMMELEYPEGSGC